MAIDWGYILLSGFGGVALSTSAMLIASLVAIIDGETRLLWSKIPETWFFLSIISAYFFMGWVLLLEVIFELIP